VLYTKSIGEVEWKDVEAFCEQRLAEGAYLDYKVDFPSHLEKTIAAMGNTLGGIILIGVDEDAESRPTLPLKGIAFQRGLAERVTNIILSNITPPLFPEIQVCPDDAKALAVLVVRIVQSHQTPHAMSGNTEVYLRTGNRNTPERLATVDEIEWLREHRKRSSDLREVLYSLAEERFTRLYARQRDEIRAGGQQVTEVKNGWLTLSLCPLYPKDLLKLPPELDELKRRIGVPDYMKTATEFPIPSREPSKIVQHGIVFARVYDEDSIYHTELNGFGLYFYRQALLRSYKSRATGEDIRVIRSSEVFCRLDEFIDSAAKFYTAIGYWGALQFRLDLSHIEGCRLGPFTEDPYDDEPLTTLESEVRFDQVVLAPALSDTKPDLILNAAQRVAWAFGWNVTSQFLDRFYRRLKK
jgi:hypothetical protein